MHSTKIKLKAKLLREKGWSINEISLKLGVAKSTISVWVSDVYLDEGAKKRIDSRVKRANRITKEYHSRNRKEKQKIAELAAQKVISKNPINKELSKLLCSFLYWGEGGKTEKYVSFINSDPKMIRSFTNLIRLSFDADESRFRAMVHIHEYHSNSELKEFWSGIANIPLSQFSQSYKKPNTGKRKKPGYMGSCRIRYYDAAVARELTAIYNAYAQKLGASVNW